VLERIGVTAGEQHVPLQPIDVPHFVAGRAVAPAPSETFTVVVESPDVGHVEVASASLPHRATVLTVRLDANGAIDVTHNLLRLPGVALPPGLERLERPYPELVRTLQKAQQLYKSGDLRHLHHGEVADLLYGKWVDPILGCMAFWSRGPGGVMDVALGNLERFFADLPDVRVVLALGRREPGYLNELLDSRTVPLLQESTRALAARALERGETEHPILRLARLIPPDQPWTMTLASRHALAGDGVPA
jgi:hypothetical protein